MSESHPAPNLLEVTNVADCHTPEQLTERAYQYIHWAVRNGYPAKLTSINRRFAPKASKLGTSAREMTNTLYRAGRIGMWERGGATIFIDTEFLELQKQHLEPTEIDQALEIILSRAQ